MSTNPAHPPLRVSFLALGGRDLAYSRVRAFQAAEHLASAGVATDVVSMADLAGLDGRRGDPVLELGDRDKLDLCHEAADRLADGSPEVVVCQKWMYHGAAALEACERTGAALVVDWDDWDLDRSSLFADPSVLREHLGVPDGAADPARAALAHALGRAAGAIAASSPLASVLNELAREAGRPDLPVTLVPTGPDTERFRPSPAGDNGATGGLRCVWTGIAWGPPILEQIELLADAVETARARGMNVSLALAGAGRAWPEVEALAADRDGVTDVGWIHPDMVPDLLREHHVGLCPLDPHPPAAAAHATWWRHKSPTKLMEFMACGLPVIATDIGDAGPLVHGVRDAGAVSGDTAPAGIAVPVGGGPEAWAEALETLATDPARRTAMGAAGRERITTGWSRAATLPRLRAALESARAHPVPGTSVTTAPAPPATAREAHP